MREILAHGHDSAGCGLRLARADFDDARSKSIALHSSRAISAARSPAKAPMARKGISSGGAAVRRSLIAGVKITVSVSPTFALFSASASDDFVLGQE